MRSSDGHRVWRLCRAARYRDFFRLSVCSSSKPAAQKTLLIIPLGIAAFAAFYISFRLLITKFDLKTPGCEDNDADAEVSEGATADTVAGVRIVALLAALGGKDNIVSLAHCITRLRMDVADMDAVDEKALSAAGAKGVMKVGRNSLQVIIGMNVQRVFDALKAKMKESAGDNRATVIRCANGDVLQPVKGRVIAREAIPDETFAAGVLGDGVGIEPEENRITAPFDGVVTTVTESRHAVGLESNGMEVLIHVGVDTVSMNGDGFECLVGEGDKVKAGQTLIVFDREKIKNAGLNDTVAVVLTNSSDLNRDECGLKEKNHPDSSL